MQPARLMELAAPTPSLCTWHHCSPYAPEPKWSVNPPDVHAPTTHFLVSAVYAMESIIRLQHAALLVAVCLRYTHLFDISCGEGHG